MAEKGVPSIEYYMYEQHEMIQRAAIECMCNMVMNEKVRLKTWAHCLDG